MKERAQQRDLLLTIYCGSIPETGENVVACGSSRQSGACSHTDPDKVSHFSQCATITQFLETT
jgi:hypothetical protein